MKRFFTLMLAVFALVTTGLAQKTDLEGVLEGLKTGNAATIARYFDEKVEITVPAKKGNYAKAQAQTVLKDFFATNVISGFSIRHSGDAPGGQYAIAALDTKGGSYRVHVFMKKSGKGEVLRELRFQTIE